MPKRPERLTRYYSDYADETGVTRSQLKRLSAKRQIEYALTWFKTYFEDPADAMPYNSRESGYQWIWGGPHDAAEQLFKEFDGIIAYDRIETIAKQLQDEEGVYDWAPSPRHPDRRADVPDYDEDENDIDEPPPEERIASALRMLDGGTPPTFGTLSITGNVC